MVMFAAELEEVVRSLSALVGAPVRGVWQPRRDRVVLGLGDTHWLFVPRGPHARLHVIRKRPKNPQRPFSFQGACRAWIHGPLLAVDKPAADRAVTLRFEAASLHLRIMGGRGGLWVMQGDQVIAAYDGPSPPTLPPLPPGAPPPREPRFHPLPDESWAVAADRYFSRKEAEHRRSQREQALRRRLSAALARDRRLMLGLERDLGRAQEADTLRYRADALSIHLHRLERGASVVRIPDPYHPEVELEIAVDPARGPQHTMQQLYKKAKRLSRQQDSIEDHFLRVLERRDRWEAALETLGGLSVGELATLETSLPRQVRGTSVGPAPDWNTWTGPRGERILVGRNSMGNRRLTFQKARGHDFWMHVRGRPGAHIVLPMARGASPTLETLLAAAQVALLKAGVPEGSAAEVQYTRVKHVRSIPGDAGGRVMLHEERVLHVTRDRDALRGWTRSEPNE